TGIYVVCNDKALLETINNILRGNGVVGLQDRKGAMHFLVDARSDRMGAAFSVNDMIVGGGDDDRKSRERYDDLDYSDDSIREVFLYYGFDLALIGTKALMYLVKQTLMGNDFDNVGAKGMFEYVARTRESTFYQVERNVRYAISKSRLANLRIKSTLIISMLAEAVRKEQKSRIRE
ncbi:MAG: hypothetical protein J5685_09035, partial [Clostridiales bacterium]|nr:hypothetical protein [Clostridiales bacterium]